MLPIAILAIENDDDREFMANLYIEYRWLIYSEVQKRINDKCTIEDIVQDVVVKLIDKIDLLKILDKKRVVSYIAVAAKNSAISFLRSSAKQPIQFDEFEEFEDINADVERSVIRNLDAYELKKIWPNLKVESQELLNMKYVLMLSNAEIAEIYHIKPESIRMRLTRARREAFDLINSSVGLSK